MNSSNCELRIGAAALQTGVKIETIRYYEKVGLLRHVPREGNSYRLYSSDDIQRLIFIRKCRELGFSIKQTRSLLDLSDRESRTCQEVSEVAKARLIEVQEKMADLARMQTTLEAFLIACPQNASTRCPIIQELSR